MTKIITSWKFEGHTDGYRARVALELVSRFINHGDHDLQEEADRTSKDCSIQDLIEYIGKIIDEENHYLHKKKTEL